MKFLRRVVSAVFLGVLFAAGLKVSGVSGAPSQHGGWQPLILPDPDGAEGITESDGTDDTDG